ncbi:hypothetical protein HanRHA438_Chr16g0738791 [Helianthus annuus]|nr:hypothetical protein HanRHA438_Chr16g0738791 [Helianthus annuus]
MYICIGICERKRKKEARRTRLWVAVCDGSRKRGAVWGSGAGPSRAKPAPIPSSLNEAVIGDLELKSYR